MKKMAAIITLIAVGFILIAGCTEESKPAPVVEVIQTTSPVAITTPEPTTEPTAIATPEPVKVDPIVGHFIRVNENVQFRVGTEIIVLEDKTILINIGPSTEKSSKYTINPVFQASGTIKRVSEGKYYATVTAVGDLTQSEEVIEIRLIPESKDPDCEARIIPEHIETIGLRENEDASNQEGVPTSFKFPVRVNY